MNTAKSWIRGAFKSPHDSHGDCESTLELTEIASGQVSDAILYSTKSRRYRDQAVILITCLTLTMTGCGLGFAFGVYQELYETVGGPFQDADPASIDLIGTLSATLMTLGAPVVHPAMKRFGPRRVVLFGGVLFAISGILASFGTRIWHFQLSQGFLQGCATCLTYIPAVTISPAYFHERRALAMGIITSGTGFGGMLWAPLIRFLISTIGYRHTLRTIGMISFATTALSALALKDDFSPASAKRNVDIKRKSLILSADFISHASGTALQAAAYMIPMYFMASYARGLGYTAAAGANIIALSNACNSGGKIIIGYHADRIGRLNALVLSILVSSVVTFGICYISISSINHDLHCMLFISYACIYGITAGAYVSLFPTALVEQFGLENFSSVSGLLYMIRGLGSLFGTPLGGKLVGYGSHGGEPGVSSDYDRMFFFVGLLLCGATISVGWARSLERRKNGLD